MIRVSIYEDNHSLLESLGLLLESTCELLVVGMHENAVNILDDAAKDRPDVIIMDISMPGRSGIEAVQLLNENRCKARVLMLTIFDDTDRIFSAISAGAVGYLLKNSPGDEIIKAIFQVAEGGAAMTPSIAIKVLESFQKPKQPELRAYELTQKEALVLERLVNGDSYKLIAHYCNMSMGTVRTHIVNIYHKLHVNSKSEAVAKAVNARR